MEVHQFGIIIVYTFEGKENLFAAVADSVLIRSLFIPYLWSVLSPIIFPVFLFALAFLFFPNFVEHNNYPCAMAYQLTSVGICVLFELQCHYNSEFFFT